MFVIGFLKFTVEIFICDFAHDFVFINVVVRKLLISKVNDVSRVMCT